MAAWRQAIELAIGEEDLAASWNPAPHVICIGVNRLPRFRR